MSHEDRFDPFSGAPEPRDAFPDAPTPRNAFPDAPTPRNAFSDAALEDFIDDVVSYRNRDQALLGRPEVGGSVTFSREDRGQRLSGFDRDGDLQAALDAINADYEASVAGIGGVSASHRQAIAEAAELLSDVKGNREAISDEYDDFLSYLDPFEQRAVSEAGEIAENAAPGLEQIAEEQQSGIEADYGEASQIVADVAEQIGAGEKSKEAALEGITGKGLALESAAAEAADIMALMELEEDVFTEGAEAREAQTEGETTRRSEATDRQFAQQQEAAQDRLERARAAARAAAAAAARRRAAARKRRNAAVEQAREQLGGVSPIEAGQISALKYLNDNGAHLPTNRQEFVENIFRKGVENFIPANPNAVRSAFPDARLSTEEASLVAGAIDSFGDAQASEEHRGRLSKRSRAMDDHYGVS